MTNNLGLFTSAVFIIPHASLPILQREPLADLRIPDLPAEQETTAAVRGMGCLKRPTTFS